MAHDFAAKAQFRGKGHFYEDFEIGRAFPHHWGRTLSDADNTLFSTLTLNFNPLYYNIEYAKAAGHKAIPVCPMLVFSTVFGLSVEDLSENGGAFLGVENLVFHRAVYPGDTLIADSTVTDRRESSSNKDFGIVTWATRGINQRKELVIDFKRTNMVSKRQRATT